MKIWLALGLLGQLSALEPEKPIVTGISFVGSGCPISLATRTNVNGSALVNEFDEFQVGGLDAVRECQINLNVDLTNLCLESVAVSHELVSSMLPNTSGTLLVRGVLNDKDFVPLINISLTGQMPYHQKNKTILTQKSLQTCNGNATLRLYGTLSTTHSDPVSTNSLALINQQVLLQTYERPNYENSGPGPIFGTVSFQGSGCPQGSIAINSTSWEMIASFEDFNVDQGESKSCQITIPLDLKRTCLTRISRVSELFNAQDLEWSSFLYFYNTPIVWDKETRMDLINGEDRVLYESPKPAICGGQANLLMNTKLRGQKGAGKTGGAVKRQIFKVERMVNQTYSNARHADPQFYAIALIALLIVN